MIPDVDEKLLKKINKTNKAQAIRKFLNFSKKDESQETERSEYGPSQEIPIEAFNNDNDFITPHKFESQTAVAQPKFKSQVAVSEPIYKEPESESESESEPDTKAKNKFKSESFLDSKQDIPTVISSPLKRTVEKLKDDVRKSKEYSTEFRSPRKIEDKVETKAIEPKEQQEKNIIKKARGRPRKNYIEDAQSNYPKPKKKEEPNVSQYASIMTGSPLKQLSETKKTTSPSLKKFTDQKATTKPLISDRQKDLYKEFKKDGHTKSELKQIFPNIESDYEDEDA